MKIGIIGAEFDGTGDSIFQEFDRSGNTFMEYIHDYGAFDDLPYDLYLAELRNHYTKIFGSEKYAETDLVYDFRR